MEKENTEEESTEENSTPQEEVESENKSKNAEESQPDEDKSEHELKIEELEKSSAENHHKYLRAMADLENYKKRAMKDRAELIKYSGESVIVDFLDVLDDLDRASKAEANSVEGVLEGVEMIKKRFEGVFKKHAVEAKDYIGQDFDPNCHEALTTVPTDEHEPGVVMEQLKKAYFFKEKLIRPAQVVVSAKKEE